MFLRELSIKKYLRNVCRILKGTSVRNQGSLKDSLRHSCRTPLRDPLSGSLRIPYRESPEGFSKGLLKDSKNDSIKGFAKGSAKDCDKKKNDSPLEFYHNFLRTPLNWSLKNV